MLLLDFAAEGRDLVGVFMCPLDHARGKQVGVFVALGSGSEERKQRAKTFLQAASAYAGFQILAGVLEAAGQVDVVAVTGPAVAGIRLVPLFFAGVTYVMVRFCSVSLSLAVLSHCVINAVIFLPKWVVAALYLGRV